MPTAVTASMVAQLRQMTAETDMDATSFTNDELVGLIADHPLIDTQDELPYEWDTSVTPPTWSYNTDWVATFDLNNAAADVWMRKAGLAAQDYDFNADGGNLSRSQVYEQYMKQSRSYRSMQAMGTITQFMHPAPGTMVEVVGNLAEEDY